MDSDWSRIEGHTYYDPTKQPKSGYAVSEQHSKIRQEEIRQEFLKKWEESKKKI